MFSCLLKRVLPFTLTFMLGAFVGGLFKARSSGPVMWTWEKATPLLGHEGPFDYSYGHSCRMRARNLVAETKPLLIRFKPDARWPRELHGGRIDLVRARVTFGADGKVQQVEPGNNGLSFDSFGDKELITHPGVVAMWNAVERAARQIQFEPELINGVPVSVTKDVEIHFMAD